MEVADARFVNMEMLQNTEILDIATRVPILIDVNGAQVKALINSV